MSLNVKFIMDYDFFFFFGLWFTSRKENRKNTSKMLTFTFTQQLADNKLQE